MTEHTQTEINMCTLATCHYCEDVEDAVTGGSIINNTFFCTNCCNNFSQNQLGLYANEIINDDDMHTITEVEQGCPLPEMLLEYERISSIEYNEIPPMTSADDEESDDEEYEDWMPPDYYSYEHGVPPPPSYENIEAQPPDYRYYYNNRMSVLPAYSKY